jgi:hypothetical protein
MRYGLFVMGLIAFAAPVHAEPRSAYVTMVLQAFAAKIDCPGVDVVYQDLAQKADEMQMPEGTTEKVRNAIAYTLTGGKMGERQDDELIAEVTAAQHATDMDLKRLGMVTWCETQKPKLAGFIRTQN